MRVFVTGAAGFVGSAVTRELIAAGHAVLGLARSDANAAALAQAGAEVHRGSLEDLDSLRHGAAAADGVIHLAFNHDFSKFADNAQQDRRAIAAMGETLAGSGKPFVVTSGTGLIAPGRVATEDDPAHGADGIPRVSEQTGLAFAARGVRAMAVRLPQVHGGQGKAGFVGYLFEVARQNGVCAYVGAGTNRWAAGHRLDVARVYRLALEKGVAGASYHPVGDEGVPLHEIARTLARHLNAPVVSLAPEEAAAHFGWLARFAALDMPASSALTQQRLGWKPGQPGLLADIGQPGYFAS